MNKLETAVSYTLCLLVLVVFGVAVGAGLIGYIGDMLISIWNAGPHLW